MSNRSETFGRLLKGAINSIAAYEGKTAPAIEDELGAQIGVAGSTIQRYKAGYLPTEPRVVQILAEAAARPPRPTAAPGDRRLWRPSRQNRRRLASSGLHYRAGCAGGRHRGTAGARE